MGKTNLNSNFEKGHPLAPWVDPKFLSPLKLKKIQFLVFG